MPDENPNLDIRATLDSSGVNSGASSAVTSLASVAAATTEAAEVAKLYATKLTIAERGLVILGAEAGKATANMGELDAAMELAWAEAVKAAEANAAYAASIEASAAEMMASGEAQDALGAVTASTARKLAALSIEQSAVAATAAEMGLSMEVAAAAMIQIERARLTDTITEARLAMEGLTVATQEEGVAAGESAVANELDAQALAQRAIMMRRTSDGLVDLAMGGRRAIQGVADLQFVLTQMFPGGAVTIGILGGIALIGEIWESMSRKMEREHRETTEKIKSNIDEIAKEMETRYTPVLERQLDLQKQIQTIQKDELASINAASAAKEKSLQLDREIAIEQAKMQEIIALAGTNDSGEKKRIEAQFKTTEAELNAKGGVDEATIELQTKQAEIDATKADLNQQRDELNKVRDQIAAIDARRLQDAQFLAATGITPDSKGVLVHKKTDKSGKDVSTSAITDLKAEVDEAIENLIHAREVVKSSGGIPRKFSSRDQYFAELSKKIEDSQNRVDMAGAVQSRGLTTDSDSTRAKLQKSVEDLDATVSKAMESLERLQPELDNAQKNVDLANIKSVTGQSQATIDQADVSAKNPISYNSTKPVDDALGLLSFDAAGNTGKDSANQLGQINEIKAHIQDALKAHRDISGFILELMQMMEEFKIGSQRDRDAIQNALSAFKVSSQNNAIQ